MTVKRRLNAPASSSPLLHDTAVIILPKQALRMLWEPWIQQALYRTLRIILEKTIAVQFSPTSLYRIPVFSARFETPLLGGRALSRVSRPCGAAHLVPPTLALALSSHQASSPPSRLQMLRPARQLRAGIGQRVAWRSESPVSSM